MKIEDTLNAYNELVTLKDSWKQQGFKNVEIVLILTSLISKLATIDNISLSELKSFIIKALTELHPLQEITHKQELTTIDPTDAYEELIDLKNSWKQRGLKPPDIVGILATLITRFAIASEIPLDKFLNIMQGLFTDLYTGETIDRMKISPIKDNLPS